MLLVQYQLLNDVLQVRLNVTLCGAERLAYQVVQWLFNQSQEFRSNRILNDTFHFLVYYIITVGAAAFCRTTLVFDTQLVIGTGWHFTGPQFAIVVKRLFLYLNQYIGITFSPSPL